jgi:ABC-type antimicrobial peptide transport system permease subunit
MVVRRGMLRAAAGLVVGLLLSLVGARVLQAVLFEVRPTDPATLAAGATLLAVVALLACWLPGRRAAAIRPMEALGGE